ncbi:hypothetical protein CARUB_v10010368mg [Capsella rubella]|uniref:Uncharacterized protein n=1 Tax=Capsella rubella TaxID=81985 RepID=R0IN83_9BRAS|nr:uncharacterized protein LOC17898705 [Capsella rubella]EOA38558.1 hypothetical protein CARUB_v10010368mg [Capsella rubella]
MDTSSKTQITPRRIRRSDSVELSSTVKSSSRRSLSSSSFSSLLVSGSSPATPLHPLGVPFSWEKLPGEPKEFPYHRKNESSNNLLPLPPHRGNHSPNTRRKKNTSPAAAMRDPFTAALVECSKGATADGEHNTGGESRKVLRKSNSIKLLNLYASCRRACAVSESIVYLPRSTDRVASYDHLILSTRRRRR